LREECLQGTYTNPEYVAPAASDDVTHDLAAVAGATDNLLDRHSRSGGALNGGIVGLTTQKSFILAPLGACQQIRVNRSSSKRPTDRAHTLLDRLEEGGTRVLHQMPTVGNLDRLRACARDGMTIARTPIAGDNADTGVACQPYLYCRRMPVRQEIDDAATFKVADQGAITLASLPCEVIYADDGRRGERLS
jgi:hypothetical protein